MDRENNQAQSQEDKHTSECKKAYDVGFAEKCAEFGIDPQELLGAMEKTAQQPMYSRYGGNWNYMSDASTLPGNPATGGNTGGMVPTNPATQYSNQYGNAGTHNAQMRDMMAQSKALSKQQEEDDFQNSAWSEFGFGPVDLGGAQRAWRSAKRGAKYFADDFSKQMGDLTSDTGALLYNSTLGADWLGKVPGLGFLGRGGEKAKYSWEDKNEAVPKEKRNIDFKQWSEMSPERQRTARELGYSVTPGSMEEYQNQQTQNFQNTIKAFHQG